MTTERKSCGMSFSGPMVLALLNTKPDVWPAEPLDPAKPFKWQTRRLISRQAAFQIGQLLYDREALVRIDHRTPDFVSQRYVERGWAHHKADNMLVACDMPQTDNCLPWRWQNKGLPARYMPREAARLWLIVKAVREARVQDIGLGLGSCLAEGVDEEYRVAQKKNFEQLRATFGALWDSLHEKPDTRWADNPPVRVYEIMRTEKYDDDASD